MLALCLDIDDGERKFSTFYEDVATIDKSGLNIRQIEQILMQFMSFHFVIFTLICMHLDEIFD